MKGFLILCSAFLFPCVLLVIIDNITYYIDKVKQKRKEKEREILYNKEKERMRKDKEERMKYSESVIAPNGNLIANIIDMAFDAKIHGYKEIVYGENRIRLIYNPNNPNIAVGYYVYIYENDKEKDMNYIFMEDSIVEVINRLNSKCNDIKFINNNYKGATFEQYLSEKVNIVKVFSNLNECGKYESIYKYGAPHDVNLKIESTLNICKDGSDIVVTCDRIDMNTIQKFTIPNFGYNCKVENFIKELNRLDPKNIHFYCNDESLLNTNLMYLAEKIYSEKENEIKIYNVDKKKEEDKEMNNFICGTKEKVCESRAQCMREITEQNCVNVKNDFIKICEMERKGILERIHKKIENEARLGNSTVRIKLQEYMLHDFRSIYYTSTFYYNGKLSKMYRGYQNEYLTNYVDDSSYVWKFVDKLDYKTAEELCSLYVDSWITQTLAEDEGFEVYSDYNNHDYVIKW